MTATTAPSETLRAPFLRALGRVLEDGYSQLATALAHGLEDGDAYDADAALCDLSNATQEAADIIGIVADDPEVYGELLEWIEEDQPHAEAWGLHDR
jgi:hypothetical protein